MKFCFDLLIAENIIFSRGIIWLQTKNKIESDPENVFKFEKD